MFNWHGAISWIKMLVDHFVAICILQHHCQQLLKGPEHDFFIQVTLVRAPDQCGAFSWNYLVSTIKLHLDTPAEHSTVEGKVFDADAALALLVEKLLNYHPLEGSPEAFIVHPFQQLKDDPEMVLPYDGRPHCELLLGTLLLDDEDSVMDSSDKAKLVAHLKVSSAGCFHCSLGSVIYFFVQVEDIQGLPFTIAVSKLCCPICWDFFQILCSKMGFEGAVQGFHKSLSMVHLPDRTPTHLAEAMISLYCDHLRGELEKMKCDDAAHKHTNSAGSESTLSAATTSSHDTEKEVYQDWPESKTVH
jgi:hypothetical protein